MYGKYTKYCQCPPRLSVVVTHLVRRRNDSWKSISCSLLGEGPNASARFNRASAIHQLCSPKSSSVDEAPGVVDDVGWWPSTINLWPSTNRGDLQSSLAQGLHRLANPATGSIYLFFSTKSKCAFGYHFNWFSSFLMRIIRCWGFSSVTLYWLPTVILPSWPVL